MCISAARLGPKRVSEEIDVLRRSHGRRVQRVCTEDQVPGLDQDAQGDNDDNQDAEGDSDDDDNNNDDDDKDEGLIKMLKELKSPQKDSAAWCSLSDKLQMAEVSFFYTIIIEN